MKKFILLFSVLAASCCPNEPKFVRKEFEVDDITVKWYYHSYITNTSPEIVEASMGGIVQEIYRDSEVLLADVDVHDSTITIKLARPSEVHYNFDRIGSGIPSEVFGCKIVIDTTAAYADVFKLPESVKRCE
jgi:hypothetical protein